MPYSIADLLARQRALVSVRQGDNVLYALDRMAEHDFSQLPVLDPQGYLMGMVTHESIMRAARSLKVELESLRMRDALIAVPCHCQDDNLFDLLDALKRSTAVVILDADGRPTGMVTSFDATEFLRERAEDLLRVEEIEFIIKEFLKLSPKEKPTIDDLTLGDYINLLTARRTWSFFAPLMQIERDELIAMLDRVRKTRNDLAHFRGAIPAGERQHLKDCAAWLARRHREYRMRQGDVLLQQALRTVEERPAQIGLREEGQEYGAMAVARQERYGALASWLADSAEKQVALSFAQIEQLIAAPLPEWARDFNSWWAAGPWREAGWQISYLDSEGMRVVFARHDHD